MGMFDDIKISKGFKLPMPEKLGELNEELIQDADYQTKDLDDALFNWTINDDGSITREEFRLETDGEMTLPARRGRDKVSLPCFKQVKTGKMIHAPKPKVIVFYTSFQRATYDYWLEYTYIYNDAPSITLTRFTEEPNAERKERERVWNEENKKYLARRNKAWYKVYLAVYVTPVRWIFDQYRHLSNKLPNSYKVEKFLIRY